MEKGKYILKFCSFMSYNSQSAKKKFITLVKKIQKLSFPRFFFLPSDNTPEYSVSDMPINKKSILVKLAVSTSFGNLIVFTVKWGE